MSNDNQFIERELSQSEIKDRRMNLEEYLDTKDRHGDEIAELKRARRRLDKIISVTRQQIRSGKVLERKPDRQQPMPFRPDEPTLTDASGEPMADPREKPVRKPRRGKAR